MILNRSRPLDNCITTNNQTLWLKLSTFLSSMPARWKRRVKIYIGTMMLLSVCMTYFHYRYLTLEHTMEILRNDIPSANQLVGKDDERLAKEAVIETRNEMKVIPKEEPMDNKKYLGYFCSKVGCNGWGDRLIGILTAYVWSIITDRVFFIMISHPGPLTDVLLPNKVNWNIAVPTDHHAFTYLKLMGDEKFVDSIKYGAPKLTNITSKYIAFNNNFDHITPIAQNPLFREKLRKHGFNMTNFNFRTALRELYTDLFKLTPGLKERLELLLFQSKSHDQNKLVCLQIRIGKSSTMAKDRRHEVSIKDVHKFWEFADSHVNSPDDKIFVTTDSETVRNEAKGRYGRNLLEVPGEITHTDWFEPTKANLGMFKLILDFHVLQHCDVIGMSQSGFSALAAYQKRPFKDVYLFQNHDFVLCPDINSDEHCMTRLGPWPTALFPIKPKQSKTTILIERSNQTKISESAQTNQTNSMKSAPIHPDKTKQTMNLEPTNKYPNMENNEHRSTNIPHKSSKNITQPKNLHGLTGPSTIDLNKLIKRTARRKSKQSKNETSTPTDNDEPNQ